MQAAARMGVQGLSGVDGAGRRPPGLWRLCSERQVGSGLSAIALAIVLQRTACASVLHIAKPVIMLLQHGGVLSEHAWCFDIARRPLCCTEPSC